MANDSEIHGQVRRSADRLVAHLAAESPTRLNETRLRALRSTNRQRRRVYGAIAAAAIIVSTTVMLSRLSDGPDRNDVATTSPTQRDDVDAPDHDADGAPTHEANDNLVAASPELTAYRDGLRATLNCLTEAGLLVIGPLPRLDATEYAYAYIEFDTVAHQDEPDLAADRCTEQHEQDPKNAFKLANTGEGAVLLAERAALIECLNLQGTVVEIGVSDPDLLGALVDQVVTESGPSGESAANPPCHLDWITPAEPPTD